MKTYIIGTSAEITQLASAFGEETFNRYVLPTCPITPKASTVTGLHIASGQLFHHQTKVDSVDIQTCSTDFNLWLAKIPSPLLVCHNGKTFDAPILMKYGKHYPECELKSTIASFVNLSSCFQRDFTKTTILQV